MTKPDKGPDTLSPRSHPASQRPSGRMATAYDVAELAGVSQSAVSRTFTSGASVSESTRAKVLKAAKALKYRPNQLARTLMTNRSYIIGVAVTHIENQFYPRVLEQLSAALRLEGYRILLFVTQGIADFDPALDELLKYRVDALILASTSLSSGLAEECRNMGVPVIMFNNIDTASTIPSISGDNINGARTVAAFLVAGGHKRFGFIAGAADSSTSRLREQGFTDYLKSQDCAPPQRLYADFRFDLAMQAMRSLLDSPERPDAVFCANDHMALAAMQVARDEAGLKIGEEISITGFDDSAISAWPAFGLTTYSQPVDRMVEQTMAMLRKALSDDKAEIAPEIVSGQLIIRSSARIPSPDKWPMDSDAISADPA
ncbi:MAG: LacI family DNA-binding transcriptional regulator [Asticcacaulis sp.]